MPQNAEDLATLSRLLDEALELDPARFEAWLEALPHEHRYLLPRLRDMLAAHLSRRDSTFLARGPRIANDSTEARADELVGPYRLIREIGIGGMGAVWLAERSDGALRRMVALKLPRLTWGAGLAERMARERDIGALLEHPHIARLYDAGIDARGRPFLALEYIDGQPIDAWCRARSLDIRARLTLFLQVVRAVAYAHGRLVVHRDLKPSNVLVTADGQSHLLDFGIAKLLEPSQDVPDLTRDQGRFFTPHYASPEQIAGEPITVASDVYSLGVLLHELITGRLPYEPTGRGALAIEAAVLAGDLRPASSFASDRRIERLLRGELDAILGKALKRAPAERYATAAAFADDLVRHLDGERVLAQADSLGYRMGKVAKKHRAAFTASIVILVVIIAGAAIALVQAQRATDAAERARVVKEFVVDVFRINGRGSAGNVELRQLPAEVLLERGAKLIDTRFAGQPRLQAELDGVVASIFADMRADSLAIDYGRRRAEVLARIDAPLVEQAEANLALSEAYFDASQLHDAEAHARRAIELAGKEPGVAAKSLIALAEVLRLQHRKDDAAPLIEQAERIIDPARPSLSRARVKRMRAVELIDAGHFDDGVALYRAAIADALAAEGPLSRTAIALRRDLANTLIVHDRVDESRPYIEATVAALRAAGGANDVQAALIESHLYANMFYNDSLSGAEATRSLRDARAVLDEHGALIPLAIRTSVDRELGLTSLMWGDVQTAVPLITTAFASSRPLDNSAIEQWRFIYAKGMLFMFIGRTAEADAAIVEATRLRAIVTPATLYTVFDDAQRALNLAMADRFDEGEAVLRNLPAPGLLRRGNTSIDVYSLIVPATLARIQLERGQAQKALDTLAGRSSNDEWVRFPFDERLLRGEVLCALGRSLEGLAIIEPELERQSRDVHPNHPELARGRARAGLCAFANGDRKHASELAALARASFTAQPDVNPYFKRPSEKLDRLLGVTKPSL